MRRGDYWLVFSELCARFPGGVEIHAEHGGAWWKCVVRTPDGVKTGQSRDIGGAIEVVATNLGVTIEVARARAA